MKEHVTKAQLKYLKNARAVMDAGKEIKRLKKRSDNAKRRYKTIQHDVEQLIRFYVMAHNPHWEDPDQPENSGRCWFAEFYNQLDRLSESIFGSKKARIIAKRLGIRTRKNPDEDT